MIHIKMINEGGLFELTNLKTVINRQLVIPSYQRSYSWDEDNIEDLFNTIKDGLSEDSKELDITEEEIVKSPVFFGSVIFSKKNENTYLIIDGQQRVTTFLFILRAIQEKLREKIALSKTYLASLDKDEEKYRDKGDRASAQQCREKFKTQEKKLDKLNEIFSQIERLIGITQITDQDSKENEYLTYILKYQSGKSRDFKKNKDNILKHIDSLIDDIGNNTSEEKYRYLVDYILNTVKFCVLSIEGKNSEEYAIDVFNTLNSTGEPLTGFEVLKSKLIQKGQPNGQREEIKTQLNEIENEIKEYKPIRKDRNRQKGKLLLYLQIHRNDYEDLKLSDKNFKDQNAYIEKILKVSKTISLGEAEKHALSIVEDIEKLNNFVVGHWLPKKGEERDYYEHLKSKKDGVLLRGFDFLIDIKHDRVIPVIFKYSPSFKEEGFDLESYKKIIGCCMSFSCLWRASLGGKTGGIDAEYLKIAKNIKEGMSVEEVRDIFAVQLKNKFPTKEDWMDHLQKSEIYNNKTLTQFLLACVTLKDMASYESSKNWTLKQEKDEDGKYLGDFRIEGKNGVKDKDLFNTDVLDSYSGMSADERTKYFGEMIWEKLATQYLGL